MILTLEVSAPHAAELGDASRQVFRAEGGSIGRASDSLWVLPHSKVSGRHALISYRNGVFFIEDTSRNGVWLNSPENRLVRGRPYPLQPGDRILMDPYEIQVSIAAEPDDAARRPIRELSGVRSLDVQFGGSNPFDSDDPFVPRRIPASVSSNPEPVDDVPGQELDPLKLLDPISKHAPARKVPSAKDLELSSPLEGHYQPPAVRSAPVSGPRSDQALIPHDYDPLAPDSSAHISLGPVSPAPASPPPASRLPADRQPSVPPAIAPASSSAAAPAAVSNGAAVESQETVPVATPGDASASDLAALLAGAGLDRAAVAPELARSFGQILRVVVSGVMDVLRARRQIKDEFRMRMTQFRAADNNPLKFSANVDDALHNLLVKRNAAYLGPVEAFEDAFEDLRNHQIAMLAGMRVAFESMLAEFDPDRLQEQFDRQLKRGSLLGVTARLHYWELYRDRRQDMIKDPEASFRKLFGEEFAKAYEEQLKRLKAEGYAAKGPTRGPQEPKA